MKTNLRKRNLTAMCFLLTTMILAHWVSAEEPRNFFLLNESDLAHLLTQGAGEVPMSIQPITRAGEFTLFEIRQGTESEFALVSRSMSRSPGNDSATLPGDVEIFGPIARLPIFDLGITTSASCSTQCQGGTISCCGSPVTCQANPGEIICDSVQVTCGDYVSWRGCLDEAFDDYLACFIPCGFVNSPCVEQCRDRFDLDQAACGPNPTSATC